MIKRDFYSFVEATALLGGDRETMRQTLLRGNLNAYIEIESPAQAYAEDGEYPTTGKTEFSQWWQTSLPVESSSQLNAGELDTPRQYRLNGFFWLRTLAVQTIARRSSVYREGLSALTSIYAVGMPYPLEFVASVNCTLESLFFTSDDIERLRSPPKLALDVEKPIATRERNSLLLIIAALAKQAKVDISRPHGCAPAIEQMMQLMGTNLNRRTIGEHLQSAHKLANKAKD